MKRDNETEESGPIPLNVWDTRTKENSRWCSGCKKWLTLNAFYYISNDIDERLKYHQKQYCSKHPDYNPEP